MDIKKLVFDYSGEVTYHIENKTYIFRDSYQIIRVNNADADNGRYDIFNKKVDVNINIETSFNIEKTDTNFALETDAKTFISTLKELSKFVSKDDLRPNLQGVYFDSEYKAAVATDAHKLKTLPFNTEKSFSISVNKKRYFDVNKLEYLIKEFNVETLKVYVTEENILIIDSNENFQYQLENNLSYSKYSKYPNYTAIIPNKKDFYLSDIPTKEILDFYSDLKKANVYILNPFVYLDIERCCLILKDGDGNNLKEWNIKIEAKELIVDKTNSGLFMPVVEKNWGVGFNINFVKDFGVDGFYFSEDMTKPFIVNNETKKETTKINKKDVEIDLLKKEIEYLKSELKKYKKD